LIRRLALALLLASAGCSGPEVTASPERLPRAPELAGAARAGDDHWTGTLGDYLGHDFRTTPQDVRFERFGRALLEYRLREDLLQEHRWALAQQDIDAFTGQPDYDESERFLREVLGADLDRSPRGETSDR
jgi:hypothetical protein